MNARSYFSVTVLYLLHWTSYALEDAKVLTAIGLVETGMKREAVGDIVKNKPTAFGCYQMHKGTWEDGNEQLMREGYISWNLTQWRVDIAQDMVASAYLRFIRQQLANRGIKKPTVEQMALVWNLGFNGALKYNFNYQLAPAVKSDYCQRVGNIYRDLIK